MKRNFESFFGTCQTPRRSSRIAATRNLASPSLGLKMGKSDSIQDGTSNNKKKSGIDKPCLTKVFPVEILDKIIGKLPLVDKLNVRFVCKLLDAVVCCQVVFTPVLVTSTADSVRKFFIQPVCRNCSLLIIGRDIGSARLKWLTSTHLKDIQTLRFDEALEDSDLKNVVHLIGQAGSLHQLVFNQYDFSVLLINRIASDAVCRTACNQIRKIVIKASSCWQGIEIYGAPQNPATREKATLDCKDFSNFPSLESLQLLRMGCITLTNIEMLPTTLKVLQICTVPIPRESLQILANRMINIERLWIHSNHINVGHGLTTLDFEVPLDGNTLEMFLSNDKLKDFNYVPILETTANRHLDTVNALKMREDFIQECFKCYAHSQSLMLRKKRQVSRDPWSDKHRSGL